MVMHRKEINLTFGEKYRCLDSRRESGASPAFTAADKGRSNEEGKYMEFRPEGLAFFWPRHLFVIPTSYEVGTPRKHHDNQSEIPAGKCQSYFFTAPKLDDHLYRCFIFSLLSASAFSHCLLQPYSSK